MPDISGTSGDDTLVGTGGNDTLRGGAGNDALYGGDGDDSLQGGVGADYMAGGTGNDTYFVDDIGDNVIEAAGEGIDTVVISGLSNYALDSNVEIGKLGGIAVVDPDGFQNLSGNALNNVLQGNASRNGLYGGAGNDSVYGYGGDDIINGGAGNDILVGGDGIDLLSYKVGATGGVTVDLAKSGVSQDTGSAGVDKASGFENLEGTQFSDVLSGDAGANKINGLGGDDYIRGRAGDDEIVGGADADTIRFEAAGAANGVDTIRVFDAAEDTFEFSSADYDSTATLTLGSAAVGSGAQFIYDSAANTLSYDADGDAAGAAVLIAYILPDAALTSANFTFV